jgi:hypothetical protein
VSGESLMGGIDRSPSRASKSRAFVKRSLCTPQTSKDATSHIITATKFPQAIETCDGAAVRLSIAAFSFRQALDALRQMLAETRDHLLLSCHCQHEIRPGGLLRQRPTRLITPALSVFRLSADSQPTQAPRDGSKYLHLVPGQSSNMNTALYQGPGTR